LTYRVDFTPQALEDLSSLDPAIARRISSKIQWLSENFDRLVPEPLTGQYKGLYKLRTGDWRVLYTADSLQTLITIRVVAHRSKVYKI